jgi:hypothetical protein
LISGNTLLPETVSRFDYDGHHPKQEGGPIMASPVLIVTKETHRPIIGASEGKGLSPLTWPNHLLQIARGYFVGRRDRLDLEEAPDFIKRDLGFLDGHAPYREEDRIR